MKLHHLIRHRHTLLRQTRLANLAFAYAELGKYADRIARGRLHGQVTLQLADPAAERAWPVLVAEEGSQAVVDEHFLDQDILDQDILDLADLLVFAAGDSAQTTFTFRLEEFAARYLPSLRQELEAAGVELTPEPDLTEGWNRE